MRFLITAGGTREHIDPVRFISNASSGRMGYALARCALRRKHQVTLVAASVARPVPPHAEVHRVVSARDMFDAVQTLFRQCDCLIMCAAVSDYTVANPAPAKIKKRLQVLTLKLVPTVDILAWAGSHKREKGERRQLVCGFALEDEYLHENAEKKLREKHLDLIIANSPSAIGANTSSISLKIPSANWKDYPVSTKDTNARRILRTIEDLD